MVSGRSPGRKGGPGGTLCGILAARVRPVPAARWSCRKPLALTQSPKEGRPRQGYSVTRPKSPSRKKGGEPLLAHSFQFEVRAPFIGSHLRKVAPSALRAPLE